MIRIIALSLVMTLLIFSHVYAGFDGPFEILGTTYGTGNGQVGFQRGDSGDLFPYRFTISVTGRIALFDELNDRVVVYRPDGSFERNINILSTSFVFDSFDSLYFEAKFRKVDKNGAEIFVKDVGFDEIFVTLNDEIIGYDSDQHSYILYSTSGQLIKTSTMKPLELGVAVEEVLDTGSYKTTVTYHDAIYALKSDKQYDRFTRDSIKNIYALLPGLVDKFNICGKRVGRLVLPKDQVFKGGEVSDRDRYIFIHSQYGEPVVDVHGNVYTWQRTPSKYSIIKWTWVDDPNTPTGPDAPGGLTVTPSTSGLYLTWNASPQDPGCVTGYEISRATTAGGIATTVATVNAGTVKYNDTGASAGTTYYYKVRAKAGSEYSAYTSEVSGKR